LITKPRMKFTFREHSPCMRNKRWQL